MKLNSLALASLILVASSAQADDAQPFKKISDETKLRKIIVERSELKDPFTVQFRNVYVREVPGDTKGDSTKHVYCGELNAKNGYGGYSGWSRFLAQDLLATPSVTVVDNEPDSIMVARVCKNAPNG